jgi:hypothetical protein
MWEEQKSDPLASAARGPFFVLPTLRLFCSSHVILCIGPKKVFYPCFYRVFVGKKFMNLHFLEMSGKIFLLPLPARQHFWGKIEPRPKFKIWP